MKIESELNESFITKCDFEIYGPNVILTQNLKSVSLGSFILSIAGERPKWKARSKAHRECQNKAINPLKNIESRKRESAVDGERQTAVVSIRIQTDLFQFSYTKTVERVESREREFTIRFYAFASGTEMLLKRCCDSEYVNEYKHCCFANTFRSLSATSTTAAAAIAPGTGERWFFVWKINSKFLKHDSWL